MVNLRVGSTPLDILGAISTLHPILIQLPYMLARLFNSQSEVAKGFKPPFWFLRWLDFEGDLNRLKLPPIHVVLLVTKHLADVLCRHHVDLLVESILSLQILFQGHRPFLVGSITSSLLGQEKLLTGTSITILCFEQLPWHLQQLKSLPLITHWEGCATTDPGLTVPSAPLLMAADPALWGMLS